MALNAKDRFLGAWWGAFLGDAIASPSHGYSSEKLLREDYGRIEDFIKPKDEHPESVLSSIKVPDLPPQFDYLNTKRPMWRKPFTHPHYGLEAGENTLPLVLALHFAASMAECGGKLDCDKWLERYRAVMTTPSVNRDMFVPSIHRRYFENLASGKQPEKNGCADAHISDIATYIPLMFQVAKNAKQSRMDMLRVLKYFTVGESSSGTAYFFGEIMMSLMSGATLEETLYTKMTPDRHFALAFPYRRWIKSGADAVNTTGRLATLDEAVPLTLYLSLKHSGDLGTALIENANIGGESTGRGAFVGMFVGAQVGRAAIPDGLISRLRYFGEIQAVGEMLYRYV